MQVDEAVRILSERIHRGLLVPGQRLIEAELVADLGIGRASVREVLRSLESAGLVRIERNRGASIRRISRKEVTDTLEVLGAVSFLLVRKTTDRVRAPQVRRALEQSLAEVLRFQDQLSDLLPSRVYMNEHARFWKVLSDVADNPVLASARFALETQLFRLSLDNTPIAGGKRFLAARHEEILRAILRSNGAEAQSMAEESLRFVQKTILGLPDSAFDQTTESA